MFHQSTIQRGLTFFEGGEGVHGQNGSQNFRFYKCYDISFNNFCEIHPLICKNRFLSLKKYFQNISPHLLDAAGGQISYL